MSTSRFIAIKVLTQVLQQNGSLSTQLSKQVKHLDEGQGLIKELCFGVCRFYPQLNTIALSLLQKPFEEKDTDLYANLLMGLYQLDHMSIPDHAVLHEAVELCRELDKEWATKLTNAVLRRYLREKEDILANLVSQPSMTYNMPKWLVKRFQKYWPEHLDSIIEATNAHPPMCIRVNSAQVSRETYQHQLLEKGIVSHETSISESGLYLDTPIAVHLLPEFAAGASSVQDESAQLAAEILHPAPGEKVLDACAAPGGKTGHLLELAPECVLTAVELEAWRLARIEENLDRLGLSAELHCADAGALETWWDGQPFDKVLLDAPCSATGVIRRNPDIKINRKPADIEELVAIQKQLLAKIWQTVKPGGYLLYGTCSLMQEENEQQIAGFLEHHQDAEMRPLNHLNATLALAGNLTERPYGTQLFPTIHGHDGFYYCLLQKRA